MSLFSIDVNSIINDEVLAEGLANVRKKYLTTGIVDENIFNSLLEADPTRQKNILIGHLSNYIKHSLIPME
jgi:hypothetical protein